MTPKEMSEIRNKRIIAAVNMEKPDRIPITNFQGLGYFKFIDPKATIADYFRNARYIDDLLIEAAKLPDLAEIDNAPNVGTTNVATRRAFAAMYFAKIKLPGIELSDDAIWNIDEQGPMTEEDYDTVIDKGWEYMTAELNKRIDWDPATIPPPDMEYMTGLRARIAELGKASIPLPPGGLLPFPSFEVLSGARKLPQFFRDLRRMPEKVKAVLDIMDESAVKTIVKLVSVTPTPVYGNIAGTRAGSDFVSPKIYEKFYHPFYQKAVPAMQAVGVKTWLHQDSDWTGFLPYFKEFPKGQCIWDTDQMTGMAKIKEVLGDIMAIEGDVPPSLLVVASPDECYKYAKDLMDLMGDAGFLMSVGCAMPPNARRENVAAVVAAVTGK